MKFLAHKLLGWEKLVWNCMAHILVLLVCCGRVGGRFEVHMTVTRAFFLVVHAGTAFWNLFEGTNFQKSKNKIVNKSSVSKFKEFS
jgi:hypothetical protein